MLNQILDDPKLTREHQFSIVLLPPYIDRPYTFDYLAKHVIHIPLQETSNPLLNDKPLPPLPTTKEEKNLVTICGDIFKSSHGCIISSSNKSNILYSKLLYNNRGQCTHLLLYLDKDVVVKDEQENEDSSLTLKMGELRHKDDILPKMDILISRFCNTSSNCDSLQSLHHCMKETIECGFSLIESTCKNSTHCDEICMSFENRIMEETYDVAFFNISQLLLAQDNKLSNALEASKYLDFPQIGLPAYVGDERKKVERATALFEKIGSFRTPIEKLECLLQTISVLTDTELLLGTDALVPLLLMTLIRSKVPHLIANFVYIKDYNFERNVTSGLYGYSLSTLEGVLDYVIHSSIPELSLQNQILWSSIREGNQTAFQRHYCARTFDPRDTEGNNALLLACLCGQTEIIEYILHIQGGVKDTDVNDLNMTPLICAVKSKSRRSVSLLLQDKHVLSTLFHLDNHGYSALMYVCMSQDVLLLKQLLACTGLGHPETLINTFTGDSVFHVSSSNRCSFEFMLCLLDLPYLNTLVNWKNKNGQTFYYLCHDREFIQYLYTHGRIDMHFIFQDIDRFGQCPLMAWAAHGRLDIVEIFSEELASSKIRYADYSGRTLLHMIATRLNKGLIMGDKSLDFIVEKFKYLIHAYDWPKCNTPLHLAVETATVTSVSNTSAFIKALQRHGARLDSVNLWGEQPMNVSRMDDITCFLDLLTLRTHHSSLSKRCGYSWYVTRASIEHLKESDLRVDFIICSEQKGRRETVQIVKRSLQDFLLLRKELLYEIPELVLPTLNDMIDPSSIHLDPPSYLLINSILQRLQCFMEWLQYHPLLHYHDLVMTFVRSSSYLEPSVIRDHSFSRRRLLEEKLQTPSIWRVSRGMNSMEEEYFFKYIQETIVHLKDSYLNVLNTGRKASNIRQDLQVEQSNMETSFKVVIESPDLSEVIKVCAKSVCNHAVNEQLTLFLKGCQMSNDLMEGIMLSLKRPLSLISERSLLRQDIEYQKETLRKTKTTWQTIFSKEKKTVEQEKDKVIQNMKELNYLDNQIIQSHQIVSDELAHFQHLNSKRMIRYIRSMAYQTLEIEKYRLNLLIQSSNKWETSFSF